MQIVIDIPDDNYKRIKELAEVNGLSNNLMGYSLLAIAHGTVLPKGHGDLIDRDFVVNILEREVDYAEDFARHRTLNYILDVVIDGAKTVIPADK